jgi:tetratricopeptide (TPR) repeat protein
MRGNQLAYDTSMLAVAGEMYRSALDEDPDFAPAWAKLGRVHRILAKYGAEGADDHLKKADEAFKRALDINPDLSVAHNLYTNFEIESLGRAKEAIVRLLGRVRVQAADPELFAGLVTACRFCGLLDASLAADRHARRLDPTIRTSVMYTHFMRGDWDRVIETDTDDLRWVTNWTLPLVGRTGEAIANYRRISQLRLPRTMLLMTTAAWQVLEGRHDEAVETIREFSARPFDPEGMYLVARALVLIDEHAWALDLFEHVIEAGFFCPQILLRDPWLDPVRSERRFNGIVARARERSQDAEAEFRRLGGDQLLSLS